MRRKRGARRRHLTVVPDDGGRPGGAEVVAASAAHRFYEGILGPVGTDPDETGDPELVAHFRRPNGTLASRARLERELAVVLTTLLDDDLDNAVFRLAEHLADVLVALGPPRAEAR